MRKKSQRKKYDKLVRDKIPQVVRRQGGLPIIRIADDAEYWEKLLEEVREFNASETAEELADILEVVDALMSHQGFTKQEVQTLKKDKLRRRGGFDKRIILIES